MSRTLILILAALCLCAPGAATADAFSVSLGKTRLGSLTVTGRSAAELKLVTVLANTPLGVFNGRFDGSSVVLPAKPQGATRRFTGITKSSRKSRSVSLVISQGKAVETQVAPTSEETALSNVDVVPAGVVDPVVALKTLIDAKDCPGPITIYDGRRVIALSPEGRLEENGDVVCRISYRVIAGPGHLSPLKIRRAQMQLTYARSGDGRSLTRISLGSRPFLLVLDRAD